MSGIRSICCRQESGRGWLELLALGLHYGWYLGICFSWLPPAKAALFVVLSQMFAGFLLSIVFVQVGADATNVYGQFLPKHSPLLAPCASTVLSCGVMVCMHLVLALLIRSYCCTDERCGLIVEP